MLNTLFVIAIDWVQIFKHTNNHLARFLATLVLCGAQLGNYAMKII